MSKKFARQLGVLLGSSGSSSRSHTRRSYTKRAPRQSAAQKSEERAFLLRQEIERRKAQSAEGCITEKKCEHCLTMIPLDAKFCPNPNCRMSKPLSEWFWLILFFVMLFVIIKCSIP